MSIQRSIVQIIALSIALLAVTDYLEQSWLSKRITSRQMKNNNDNYHQVLVTTPTSSTDTKSTTTSTTDTTKLRSLQDDSLNHFCGQNELRNSHLELGVTGYWEAMNSELVLTNAGFGSINDHAIEATNRSLWFAGMYQPIRDTSCFGVHEIMDISFKVKLIHTEPVTEHCDPTIPDNKHHCPMVILGTNYEDGTYYHEHIYDTDMIWNEGQWNSFHVSHILTPANIAVSEETGSPFKDIYVMFLGGQGNLVIDNVVVRQLPCYGTNVIVNGGAEDGVTIEPGQPWDKFGYREDFWNVSTVEPASGNHSFLHFNRSQVDPGFNGQSLNLAHIDSSGCMTIGSVWKVTAKFRLWDPATNRSSFDTCTIPNEKAGEGWKNCPAMLFTIQTGLGTSFHYLNDENMLLNWDPYGWNSFEVMIDMDQTMAGDQDGFYGPKLYVILGSSTDDIYIDDITMERMQQDEIPTSSPTMTESPTQAPTSYCGQNYANWENYDWTFNAPYVLNDLDSGHYSIGPWSPFGGSLGLETPGYGGVGHAMKVTDRHSWSVGPYFWNVDVPTCVLPDPESTWKIEYKVKMYYQDSGLPVTTCVPGSYSLHCPLVRMLFRYDNPDHSIGWLRLFDNDMVWPTDGSWTTVSIFFTIPESKMSPDLINMAPIIAGGPPGSVLLLDDIIFQQIPTGIEGFVPTATPTQTLVPSLSPTNYCTKNSIKNPDAGEGTTDQWWAWSSVKGITSPGYDGINDFALTATNRHMAAYGGLAQRLDPSCLKDGTSWRIRFDVKITDGVTGEPFAGCDPKLGWLGRDVCPWVNLFYKTHHDAQLKYYGIYDTEMEWKSDGSWNRYDIIWKPDTMVFTDGEATLSYLLIAIIGGPNFSTLTLDNVQFEQLETWETPTQMPSQSPMPSITATEYCERNHFVNGGGEEYPTYKPWMGWGNSVDMVGGGYGGSSFALRAYDRTSWHRGLGQWIDPTCVSTNSTWHLQAKVKLIDQATGQPITTDQCNPLNTMSNSCPMMRLITSKPKVANNETASGSDRRRHLRLSRHLEDDGGDVAEEEEPDVENEFFYETFRDTNMTWNDDGDWVELNVYIRLNEANSGEDITTFVPYIVGGPPGSLLLVDDASMARTNPEEGDERYSDALSSVKTCSSTGDPHIESHHGVLFDNHELGWTTMFNANGIKVETEQVPLGSSSVTFNRGFRISENGIVTAQGDTGSIPESGIYFVPGPITVLIHVLAVDMTQLGSFGDWMYNIMVTTSQFADDDGLCSRGKPTDDLLVLEDQSPLAVKEPDPVVAQQAADACSGLIEVGGDSVYQSCVKDVLIIPELKEEVSVVYADSVAPLRRTIDLTAEAVELPEDGSSPEQEKAVAEEVKEVTDPLTVDAATLRDAGLDPATVNRAGVEGDPVIIGLQQQSFGFEGESDKWYANFASQKLQWNVKFHHFDSCVGEDGMYITSMAYNIQRSDAETNIDSEPHQILVSITDESQVFPGCAEGQTCLSDGSLQINIDGVTWTQPGDYRVSDDLRIIAFNTYDACARKWYDYEEGQQRNENHNEVDKSAMHRRVLRFLQQFRAVRFLQQFLEPNLSKSTLHPSSKKQWSFMDYLFRKRIYQDRSLPSMSQSPLDIIRQSREHMLHPTHCSRWLEHRYKNDDLFTQTGGWAMIYIETPQARFQLQHRQVRKTREVLEGGGSGAQQDLVVEGMLFEGNRHLCKAHVMDGWLAQSSAALREENHWNGILGETQELKYHDNGEPILLNRDLILIGEDTDYEVSHPFDTDFQAKYMTDQVRSLWQQAEKEAGRTRRNNDSATTAAADRPTSSSVPPTIPPHMYDYSTTTTFAKKEDEHTTMAKTTLQSLWNSIQAFFETLFSVFNGILF